MQRSITCKRPNVSTMQAMQAMRSMIPCKSHACHACPPCPHLLPHCAPGLLPRGLKLLHHGNLRGARVRARGGLRQWTLVFPRVAADVLQRHYRFTNLVGKAAEHAAARMGLRRLLFLIAGTTRAAATLPRASSTAAVLLRRGLHKVETTCRTASGDRKKNNCSRTYRLRLRIQSSSRSHEGSAFGPR